MSMHPQQELSWIWLTLWEDLRVCEAHLDNSDKKVGRTGNPWRRHYVRAFLALVEAVTHNMRQLLIARHEEGTGTMTHQEFLVLHATQLELDDSGNIRERDVFYKTLPLIKCTLKCFAKYAQREDELATALGKNAWCDFREVQQTRNAITHPKETNDLVLDDEIMLKVKRAGDWFVQTVIDLIKVDFTKPRNDATDCENQTGQ